MNRGLARPDLDGILFFLALLLAILRATMFIYLHPDPSILLGPAWIEIALWLLVVIVMLYRLSRDHRRVEYLAKWRRVWFLSLFLLLALASIVWSIAPLVTFFQSLELLLATLIAAYLGIRYSPEQLLETLFWFGALLLIFSIAVVFSAPTTGTMYWQPFDGAWRGIFWHRNHLSSMAAMLSVVFLCRALLAFERRLPRGVLDGAFYLLSIVVLLFAESATAYILFLLLNSLALGVWIWLKVRDRLQSWHYYAVLGILLVGTVMALSNLNSVLGLFNRDATLTGRTGLWKYLVNDVAPRRLWLGHGFGAFWTLDVNREEVRQHIRWPSQPLIADNGFLDIFLHLGIAGLALMVVIVLVAGWQAIRYALINRSLASFFPSLFIVYAIVGNLPFSLLAETEVFVWLLLVALLFLTMPDVRRGDRAPH